MVTLLFVGCGSKASNKETSSEETGTKTESTKDNNESKEASGIKATISVQVEKDWMDYYAKAAERVLAKNPESKIEFVETTAFKHLDILDQTDLTNKDVADVFAIPADRIYGLAQNEILASMDAKTMAEHIGGFGDYDAGLGGNFKIDDGYLAFPMNIETLINFVNTKNADTLGINPTQSVEFTDLGYQDMLVPVFNAWFGVALTNTTDLELLGKDDSGMLFSDLTKEFSELTKEQQELFKALFNYWKAHYDAKTDMWDKDAVWGYMDSEFSTGGVNAIRLEGPWSTKALSEKAGNGEDLSIVPISNVTLNGSPLAHWKGGWGLGINARIEEDKDKMMLAQALIEEIVNRDYAVELFKASGKILENVDASVYENSDLSDMDKKVVSAVIESYKNAPARPLFTEWGAVWETWENSLLSWGAVKPATVEEAYAQVKAAFEAMMMNF